MVCSPGKGRGAAEEGASARAARNSALAADSRVARRARRASLQADLAVVVRRGRPAGFELLVGLLFEFLVHFHDMARAKEVSCRYNAILPVTSKQYVNKYNISMEVGPNETERFQVILATEKSAKFTALFKIQYNHNQVNKNILIYL